uniref:Putative secreted protein n=1 Tax=Amblyomma tuberculatum TaxID=48802 RepID=A0A6M2E5Y7_9ACAR
MAAHMQPSLLFVALAQISKSASRSMSLEASNVPLIEGPAFILYKLQCNCTMPRPPFFQPPWCCSSLCPLRIVKGCDITSLCLVVLVYPTCVFNCFLGVSQKWPKFLFHCPE